MMAPALPFFAPLFAGGDVGQDKELAPRMGPAERLGDRPRRAAKRMNSLFPRNIRAWYGRHRHRPAGSR